MNGQTDGQGQIDSAIDPDQKYIFFIRSGTLPSTFFIHFNEPSVPLYSTNNGYNNKVENKKNKM